MILSWLNRVLICYCRTHDAIRKEKFGAFPDVEERNGRKDQDSREYWCSQPAVVVGRGARWDQEEGWVAASTWQGKGCKEGEGGIAGGGVG